LVIYYGRYILALAKGFNMKKIFILVMIAAVVFMSCPDLNKSQVRIYNMQYYGADYVYVGTSQFTGISAQSKTDYEYFLPGVYTVRVLMDNSTDFSGDITVGYSSKYSVVLFDSTISLVLED
jgi:hypothetical protein